MKRFISLSLVFLLVACAVSAQHAETFDMATFQPPKGWTKKSGTDGVQFSIEDTASGGVCLITLFRSAPAIGGAKENFDTAWRTIVKETVSVSSAPEMLPADERDGWQVIGGFAPFENSGQKGVVMLYTASGGGRMVNAIVITNTQAYESTIAAFLGSITLKKPAPGNLQTQVNGTASAPPPGGPIPAHPARKSGFTFTENRFNNGWTAVEQDNWVRVTKGGATVLIHHELPDLRQFNDIDEKSVFVWNKIVAPRYSDLKNFYARRGWYADGDSMNGKYYVEGEATDRSSGKRVFVALFKNGHAGRWLEFIMPDKQAFQKEFTTVYPQDGTDWPKLAAMIGYNKFAVAPGDIPGMWKSSGAAGVDLYNIYTGDSLGMATISNVNEFTFLPNGSYTEVYKSAGGVGAGLNYYGETKKGRYSVSNSSVMTLTNRFKSQPHEFEAYFEAVKGGRILHLIRGSIEELHLYKVR